MVKRLQNKIAESRLVLPVTAVLVLLVWLAGGVIEKHLYVRLALLYVSTFFMAELNNRNALIRIYSRMVSCSFLVLTTMAAFAFKSVGTFGVQLCMIAFYAAIFGSYQDKRAHGLVFYAFLCLGIASTFFIQILFFVPILWVLIAVNLMAFGARTIPASLIGLTTPYWFLAAFHVFTGDITSLFGHLSAITDFAPLCSFEGTDTRLLVTFAYVSALSILGTVHFFRNSYKDKIRTRMIYELIITMNALTFVFTILQPQHIEQLLGLMIITAGTLVAHFIALTRTRFTNIAFYIIVLSAAAITLYNIWTS